MPLDEMTFSTVAGLLNSHFRVLGGPVPVNVKLTEVTPFGSADEPVNSGNFSLIFAGPLEPLLPQKTYRFEHETLGAFDLFIVPVAKNQTGFSYEAVFNRTARRI